jgi:hypothetical protein
MTPETPRSILQQFKCSTVYAGIAACPISLFRQGIRKTFGRKSPIAHPAAQSQQKMSTGQRIKRPLFWTFTMTFPPFPEMKNMTKVKVSCQTGTFRGKNASQVTDYLATA